MALIDFDSEYLTGYGFAASEEDRVTALIASAGKAMEKFCRREFESSERSYVLPVQNGSVLLPAFPVITCSRVLTDQVGAVTLACTANPHSYSVTQTGLSLVSYTAGVRTSTSLLFATYPTLSSLVAALPSGWSGSVSSGYGAYPSIDLVWGVSGTGGTALPIWTDASDYYCDLANGIVNLGYSSSNWFIAGDSAYCSRSAKVVWTGGYTSIPEDLQQACGEVVGSLYSSKNSGALVSENLGDYSYTLDANRLSALSVSTRQILNSYRNRIL